ncbi:MAG TPA: (2Fe-2S)-binding protein [Streptosporangiaceae bacterium]|nr:(2Fe-2S)-binding protein [Streptosporangiaceae bacterium]
MTRSSAPAARTATAGRLAELAALGPYFGIEIHPAGEPPGPPWQPLGALTGAGSSSSAPTGAVSSPGTLAARIGEVRERLAAAAGCAAGDVEFRVAASVAQLGLCARLLSPVLGAAAAGWALPVDAARARWIPALGGPFRLSLPETAAGAAPATPVPGDTVPGSTVSEDTVSEDTVPGSTVSGRTMPGTSVPGAGTAACLALLAGPVAQITRAVEAMAVSPRVLWGNVASAVSGAAAMIAKARPDLAAPASAAATAMLRYPALTGTHEGSPGAGFRRRNCCLIYRLSPPGAASYCGDCVLGPV